MFTQLCKYALRLLVICLLFMLGAYLFPRAEEPTSAEPIQTSGIPKECTYILLEHHDKPDEYADINMPDLWRTMEDLVNEESTQTSEISGDWIYRVRMSPLPDGDLSTTKYFFVFKDGYLITSSPAFGFAPEWHLISDPDYMPSFLETLDVHYQQYKQGYLFRYDETGYQHGATNGER